MPTAAWKVAQQLHRTLGIARGVIVQATTYGADHAVVLDALANLNRFRRSTQLPGVRQRCRADGVRRCLSRKSSMMLECAVRASRERAWASV
ncbi:hypothetical protein ACTMU2_20970 [Cupriavidus basilensis]